MLVAVCPGCKARYRVPDVAAGKRTTCKKCGAAFRIPGAVPPAKVAPVATAPAPADSLLGMDDLDVLARGEAVDVPRSVALAENRMPGATPAPDAALRPAPAYAAAPLEGTEHLEGAYLGYLAAVGKGLAFVRKPGNIPTLVVLWLVLGLREIIGIVVPFTPCLLIGPLGVTWLVLTGWYMAFKLNLVVWASVQEEGLPGLVTDEGWFDGVLIPFGRMLGTYIFALLPATVFWWTLQMRMSAAVGANPLSAGTPAPGASAVFVLVALVLLGLFVWPMMVLAVSCGGSVRAMFQLDLIGETILKSWPAYLLTVLTVYATFGVQAGVMMLIAAQWGQQSLPSVNWLGIFGLPLLLVGVTLYFDVVAMQAIGYYYAHFKHKFAWSWG